MCSTHFIHGGSAEIDRGISAVVYYLMTIMLSKKRRLIMKRRVLAGVLSLLIAVAFIPSSAFAASKVKMKGYDRVVKSGDTVYIAGAGKAIYKVKVKKGKIKSKKTLQKGGWATSENSFIRGMKKKGDYLYYLNEGEASYTCLYRINVKSGKTKLLRKNCYAYAIKKNRIYAHIDCMGENIHNEVMKLNGQSKKTTSIKPVLTTKNSNAKGYSVKYSITGKYVKTCLKTPKQKRCIGKTTLD